MRVLVTGATGQLGYDVMEVLRARGIEAVGTGSKDLDITDYRAVEKYMGSYRPTAVIHCGAYTAVDRAEDEVEACRRVNATGTANLAKLCKELKAKLLYISTDYVFQGVGQEYYETTDPTGPQNIYGLTKLEGEEAVRATLSQYFIVRISWVFGLNGNNFVKTMLRLGAERPELTVVGDQVGSPTYTADLAPLLVDMIAGEEYGTYHATNEGVCSWAEFAQEIFKQAGLSCRVKPITTAEYPTRARRPLNSRLSKAKLQQHGFSLLPPWQEAVKRYLQQLQQKG